MRYVAFSTNNLVSFNFIRCIWLWRGKFNIWGLHRTFPICNCCWVELAIRCRAIRWWAPSYFELVAGLNLPLGAEALGDQLASYFQLVAGLNLPLGAEALGDQLASYFLTCCWFELAIRWWATCSTRNWYGSRKTRGFGNLMFPLSFALLGGPFVWYGSCKRRGFGNLMFPLSFSLLDGSFVWYASREKRGFGNLMFPLSFALLGGSFVFLDVSPSILFLLFGPFLGALVLFDWQGLIIIDIPRLNQGFWVWI